MTLPASRRDFLATTAATGLGFWAAGGATAAQNRPGPNERINIGIIGAGGRGAADTNGVAGENIVAMADVDEVRAAGTFRKFPNATKFRDFRVMLDKQKNIDAVVVATPDHVHALASITAMRMGKHCYTEKPLCHSIFEARLMKETAQKHKVATQMGNQHSASDQLRRAVEIVQSGALGDVREVHIWTNRPTWPQNLARPGGTPAVPKTLEWDLWLGPAPQRAYNAVYLPHNWRGWWDFGTGAIGDMGCHTMNMPVRALRLTLPTAVSAELDTPLSTETGPLGCKVTYEFPARDKLPPVTLCWYERRRPDAKLLLGQKFTGSGAILVGSRGTMYSMSDNGDNIRLLPEKNFQGFKDPPRTLPRAGGAHHREWLNAIRGGPAGLSNFVDYAAHLAEIVLLGNVAIRAGGKRVVWNAEKMQAVGLPAADALIRREYRKGWAL